MNSNLNNEDKIMRTLAEEQVKKLSDDYMDIAEDHADTSNLDVWFESFIEERHNEENNPKSHRTGNRRLYSRIAATVLLFLVVGSSFALSSEAIRVRIFNIFTESQHAYTSLEFGADTNLMEKIKQEWSGAYYLSFIPEGYTLVDANEINGVRRMLYRYQSDALVFSHNPNESDRAIELSDQESEVVEVADYKGIYYEDNDGFHLEWQNQVGGTMWLTSQELQRDRLLEIAESIRPISLMNQ